MTETETQLNVGLAGPIEMGQTSHLPEEPLPGQEIFKDYFEIESDAFNQEDLLSLILPKFILSPGNSIKEKSFLLLTLEGKHIPSTYAQVLKAAKRGIKVLKVHFRDNEEDEERSTWIFENARVHAVDFGYVAKERPDEPTISIEIDYESIIINEIAF